MKTLFALLVALHTLAASTAPAADNTLTPAEQAAGWKLLFNGKNLDGWRGYTLKGLPEAGWKVEDGLLKTVAGVKGKELITVEKFDDFELSWEWRVAPGGNNGIKYFVTEARTKAPGPEYHIPMASVAARTRRRRSTTSCRPPPTSRSNPAASGTARAS
jgi:hypothetical protein